MTTKPYYTLINTSRGSDPAVVVVNSALRTFDARESFPWHLTITIDCKFLGSKGMPTAEEVSTLNRLEDELSPSIEGEQNAMFLARVTCRGKRELIYRVHDPEKVNTLLQGLISAPAQLREWEYRMEQDLDWDLARNELKLLEKDTGIN